MDMVWPNRAQLDWPTITLIVICISLVGVPEISRLLPLIKKLKLGEAEIELQESVQRLHKDTERAEELPGLPASFWVRRSTQSNLVPSLEQRESENSILELASRDKESSVV